MCADYNGLHVDMSKFLFMNIEIVSIFLMRFSHLYSKQIETKRKRQNINQTELMPTKFSLSFQNLNVLGAMWGQKKKKKVYIHFSHFMCEVILVLRD